MMLLVLAEAGLVYQTWVHTERIGRVPLIEGILNTPSAHRVHHASNALFIDKNHGGVFMIWDRLFGTYADERALADREGRIPGDDHALLADRSAELHERHAGRAGAAHACQRVSAADGRATPVRSNRVNTPEAAAASCSRRVTVRSTAAALPASITTQASAPQRCASPAARSIGTTPPAATSHNRPGSPPNSASPAP
jgi:hypothetical protein